MLPGVASSSNYFKAGTQWTVEVGSMPTNMKQIVYSIEEGPITELEDSKAMRLISTTEEGVQSLEAVILSEGEKVFFRDDVDGWRLLYDFSLRPEEETVLYSGMYSPESQDYPESVVAKCDKFENSLGNLFFEDGLLLLSTYLPQTGAGYSRAIWYNGLGSVQGPLTNFENDIDGVLRNLVKVTSGDEVIFDYHGSVGVDAVVAPDNDLSTPYRLDGTPDNGQPGIILSNGKKWVRKK